MEFKSTKPVGLLAVITDPIARAMEAVDIDVLAEDAFVVNHINGNLMLAYTWGGYDSSGKWHRDLLRGTCQITVQENVDGQREIWNQCTRCPKGNPIRNYDEAFKLKVLVEHGLLANIVNSGWNFEELELTHKGISVFKKEKKKK